MFLLVSESCVPLYHPALFWTQLQSESHISRVNDGVFSVERWSNMMATELLRFEHFRKGAQWSSLTRMHAQVVAHDEHVWTQFQAFCHSLVRFFWPVCLCLRSTWEQGRYRLATSSHGLRHG